ncbi:type VI secretion system-associated protein TagF [Labrys sp. ZIDIC5]|uniref:type VI secretion system-associated protein TagF n=1 Tax=Labrys sedimenti TaxID=3106036 RepID=UPI002AC9F31E|nr:type VI secretion system-associated protein TagF [Labrys sp. ZIDIC5]MDZ5449870.1 type VI secretion system-associated protein TagF [Labrys sp. ZIDIC5]
MSQRGVSRPPLSENDGIGFFGKVPSHGDFVSTGLGRQAETELVNWLQSGLQESEQTLGTQWESLFHASPPWRFVIERSLWGHATMVGILLPSKDRVGRSFPLVIAARLSNYDGPARLFCFDESWFTAAEAIAETSTLRDFNITAFLGGLKRLRLPQARPLQPPPPGAADSRVSLWWTVESGTGRASGFKTQGAPRAGDFVRLLKGGNPTVKPPSRPPSPPPPAERTETTPLPVAAAPPPALVMERGYATHAGTRLSINADALLVSDNPRLFAVADGVSDSNGAAEAAKIVTNTLASVSPADTLETLVQDVKGKLGRAHSLVQSIRFPGAVEPASASVVTLALGNRDFAVIWAGNARCYLMREGMMRCLTRDHVEIGLRFALARSIGAPRQFVPEIVHDRAQPGDRFLLCSAALARVLDERSIATIIAEQPAKEAAAALVQEALIANVRENVSAIVVAVQAT